ncbi:MAG: NUDIX hydrolase [Saprospiraceae bacterium]
MYKIYINETPLLLLDNTNGGLVPTVGPELIVNRYSGKAKSLLQYADMLEKTRQYRQVSVYSKDYQQLVKDFESNYKLIEAAGGLVTNPSGKVLMIFRRNFWDLPKGKIDKGEHKEAAAIREVEEETGLRNIELGYSLGETYHTYRTDKGKRILKRTYWYTMKAPDQALTPQIEEDIEKAEWVDLPSFLAGQPIIYRNILDVLQRVH